MNFDELYNIFFNYIQDGKPLGDLEKNFDGFATAFSGCSFADRVANINRLLLLLNQENVSSVVKKRTETVKQVPHWLDKLFLCHAHIVTSARKIVFNHAADFKRPIKFAENAYNFFHTAPQVSVLASTNFLSKASQYIEPHIINVLDVLIVRQNPDDDSIVMAIADGAGGHQRVSLEHFKNPKLTKEAKCKEVENNNAMFAREDEQIGRAAYFMCKHATRILASCNNPDELLSQVSLIIHEICNYVKRKAISAGATLIVIRSFSLPDGRFRVVGLHVGDCLLAAWIPSKSKLDTISPARITLPHPKQEATAFLPQAFKEEEIHIIDCIVPEDTVLLPMSDGVFDGLPQKIQEKEYTVCKLPYREIYLDDESIMQKLEAKQKLDCDKDKLHRNLLFGLLKINFDSLEEQRTSNQENNDVQSIGDDCLIGSITLKKS